MRTKAPRIIILAAVLLLAAGFHSPVRAAAAAPDALSLAFTPREMLRFDLGAWLDENAPHLSPFEEAIGHWAAWHHISPRVLLTLMEQESGLLSGPANRDRLERPFGRLTPESGFREQLMAVAARLSAAHVPPDPSSTQAVRPGVHELAQSALRSLYIGRGEIPADAALAEYRRLHDQWFGGLRIAPPPTASTQSEGPRGAPIDFQFPWPVGEVWRGGGAHSENMQALDFQLGYTEWGDPEVFDAWVAAAHAGRARVWSACSVSVIDPSETWVTNYYHLENVQVANNANVAQNQVLANYADDEATATCQGGSSTGPHVHFSIAEDSVWRPIHNRVLSSFRVNMLSEEPYDNDCDLNWYQPLTGGPKVCPWQPLLNSGASNTPVFDLEVVNGSGDGQYASGTETLVEADDPPPGQSFHRWTGDWSRLDDRNSPVTTFTMGNSDALIRATFQPAGADPEVEQLLLVNADTGATLYDLDGLDISLGSLPPRLSVRARVNQADAVDRVRFRFRGSTTTDQDAPYFLGGDNGGDPIAVTQLRLAGTRTLEATPIGPEGDSGATVSARFTFRDSPSNGPGDPPDEPACGHREGSGGDFDGDGVPDECDSEAAAWTGSWYDPATSGEGLMIHAVHERLAVAYYYGYDRQGRQLWLLGTSESEFDWGKYARFEMQRVSGGDFAPFDPEAIQRRSWGAMSVRVDDCLKAVARFFGDDGQKELALERIGTVSGSPCSPSTVQVTPPDRMTGITGSWYDPVTDGQGLAIHRVSKDAGVVYFYGFDPAGDPLWLIGSWNQPAGFGDTIVVEVEHVTGGNYAGFEPDAIERSPWGQLELEFESCQRGQVRLNGQSGSQVLDLVRLAGSLGLDCS